MNEELAGLIKNMPTIMKAVSELNLLVSNLPADAGTDLTVTIGKSSLKLNKDKDKELYEKLYQSINDTSFNKIIKLRDYIDQLLYESSKAIEASEKQA
jgi:hypothetical protein